MASTVTLLQCKRGPLGRGETGDSHCGCAADKFAASAWYYQYEPESLRTAPSTLMNQCCEVLRWLWREKRVQLDTTKVYLRWPVITCMHLCVCVCMHVRSPSLTFHFVLVNESLQRPPPHPHLRKGYWLLCYTALRRPWIANQNPNSAGKCIRVNIQFLAMQNKQA